MYLIGPGIAEFFAVSYSDPASYRDDWAGPSLASAFAVHSEPAVAVLGWMICLSRRLGAHPAATTRPETDTSRKGGRHVRNTVRH